MLRTGAAFLFVGALPAGAQDCLTCHRDVTPGIVADWELSNHSRNGVECWVCHRMRAFQGVFHYGWSEMVRDLAEIRQMAEELRREKARGAEAADASP